MILLNVRKGIVKGASVRSHKHIFWFGWRHGVSKVSLYADADTSGSRLGFRLVRIP